MIVYDNVTSIGAGHTQRFERAFEATGDHLYVARIRGPVQLYVRFSRQGPAIPVREGMTLARTFSKLFVSSAEESVNDGQRTTALFYVSFGPLIVSRGDRRYGLSNGGSTQTGSINVGGSAGAQRILDLISGAFGISTLGLYGGTLVIRNTDLANTLKVCSGENLATIPPNPAGGFPVLPGESLIWSLDDELGAGPSTLQDGTLWLATDAGTCQFALFLSRGQRDRYSFPNISGEALD